MSVIVTLLSRTDCNLCDQAKAVLAKVAQDHSLTVQEIDITTPSGVELATRAGILFPPGVLLDGEPFSNGRLSERKLRLHLARRTADFST